MRRNTSTTCRAQVSEKALEPILSQAVTECLAPMIMGLIRSKHDLLSFFGLVGERALRVVLQSEAEALAGPKGRRLDERELFRWGATKATEFPLGGRRVSVPCPRIRKRGGESIGRGGKEIVLPSVEQFQANDPMPERVLEQILLGVSMRGYSSSLDPVSENLHPHGASKSAASRKLVEVMRREVTEAFSRRLDDLRLAAMMLDGIAVAQKGAILALGIAEDGSKVPLGLVIGSTENAVLSTRLLQDLLGRGLRVEGRMLFVVDGGKGLRKAVDDVFGSAAVVQRCQNHKRRNILALLPDGRHAYVNSKLSDAWASSSPKTARALMKGLMDWLDREGHDEAAQSLREGFEETLTVIKLGLTGSLRAFFSTTNAIENVMGSLRVTTANVKRWRKEDMLKRWLGVAFLKAGKSFRRIKGFKGMPQLVSALSAEEGTPGIDSKKKVA
jgi:putative transposase